MPQLHPPLHHNLSSGEIQALLFKRKNGWTVKTALEEAHHLGYDLPVGKRPHVTARYVRIRSVNPNYNKYYFRTIFFSIPDGIKAVYAFPKTDKIYLSTRLRR